MDKILEPKGRNPRITVCYTPDENQRVIEMASACGLKKASISMTLPWDRSQR